jgi:hypothetical protein
VAFQIYRVEAVKRVRSTSWIVTLLDDGIGIGNDTVANATIFSNVLATQGSTAGEAFGFKRSR